jgi:adenylate cyclase, class 2
MSSSKATSSREVEVKFAVSDLAALAKKLRAAGFRIKTRRTHEMNTLFDTAEGTLSERGEVLRIRKYGDVWSLTHKSCGESKRYKSRVETETRVEDGAKLAAIFQLIGVMPRFRYEKFRTEWTDGKGTVVVDETPIGNVAEIEGSSGWIDRTARKLGISPEEYSTASYTQLFFDWKRATGSSASEMTWKATKISKSR